MQLSKPHFLLAICATLVLTGASCSASPTSNTNTTPVQNNAANNAASLNTNSMQNSNTNSDVTPPPSGSSGGLVEPDKVQTYTLAEVGSHNRPNDCWTVIHNKVYNVTSYIARHPGGSAITAACGVDGTNLFETRPSGSRTPHSETARNQLENLYIGDLQ